MMKLMLGILLLFIVGTSSLPLVENGFQTLQEKVYENIVMQIRNKSIGLPDWRVGLKLAKWKPGQGNPEEQGSYFEGDILHPPPSRLRNGIIDTRYRWPKGVIPYKIVGQFTTTEQNMITSAMNAFHENTCIRFRAKTSTDLDYVQIESNSTGCWSYIGRIGKGQVLNLQKNGCLTYVGTAIHELLHAVGFNHEQSRLDRDYSVTINYGNISPGTERNFEKRNSTTYGLAYDYGSVMHYSKNAFSKNGLDTIVPKKTGVTIGQRTKLSSSDIAKIRQMYKCNGAISNL